MRRLAAKDPVEVLLIPVDFSDVLTSEVVNGGSCTISVLYGTDPTPSAILSGGVGVSGSIIMQTITGGVADVDYVLRFTATTDDGHVYAKNLLLPVRTQEV